MVQKPLATQSKISQIIKIPHLPETGKERVRESGLDYYPARYRDVDVGYWMSPDAARQFPNLYGNVGNGLSISNGSDNSGKYFVYDKNNVIL